MMMRRLAVGALVVAALAVFALDLRRNDLVPEAEAAAKIPVQAREVSSEAGIPARITHTHGATVADLDGNSTEDALLNYHYESFPGVMRNDGGVFTDVRQAWFPDAPRRRDYHSCPVADVDGNGRLDVYCTVGGGSGGQGRNPNELWLQGANGVFSEAPGVWGAADVWGRGREATFINANGDEWPDLFVGNAYPRKDGRRSPNRLYINVSGEKFRQARRFGVHGQIGANVAQAIDFDHDGLEDLLICGKKGVKLYRNRGNRRFRDVRKRFGIPVSCLDIEFAHMNRDRRLDLVQLDKKQLRVRLQTRKGRFGKPAFTERIRSGKTFAIADVNNDRKGDVYVVRSGPMQPEQGDPDVPETNDRLDRMLVSQRKRGKLRTKKIPQTKQGIGESVTPIDYDANGLGDFIVMNGLRKAKGPIRLIAFFPSG